MSGTKQKRWLDYLPFKTALSGMAKELGVWGWILAGLGFAMSGLVALWAWLESQLPYWAIALIFLGLLIALLHAVSLIYSMYVKRKHSRAITKLVHIDRDGLANDLEALAKKVAALVGEYRGPMQEAWWSEAANRTPMDIRQGMARIEGKLMEKYADRHGADVWILVRRASKVIPIDRGDMWQIQHGVRGEHDLINVYMFFS